MTPGPDGIPPLDWPGEIAAQIGELREAAAPHVGAQRSREAIWQAQLTRAGTAIQLGAGQVRLAALRGQSGVGEFVVAGTRFQDELILTTSLTLLAADPTWHAEMLTALKQPQINPRAALGAALIAADVRAARSDWPVLRAGGDRMHPDKTDHLTDAALACTLLSLCGLGGLERWPAATDLNHVNFSRALSMPRLNSRWDWITEAVPEETARATRALWKRHLHTVEEE